MTGRRAPRFRRAAILLGPALLGLILLGLAGCDESPVDTVGVVYDFIRYLDVAETGFERSRLRVADPAFEQRMGEGWGPVEIDPTGGSFRWTLGLRADLQVFVAAPRDVTIVCRCEPFTWPEAPAQMLHVEIGEVGIKVDVGAEVEDQLFQSDSLAVAGRTTEIPIPAEAWRRGWNRLSLVASRATAPADVIVDNDDSRELGIRVEALELRGLFDSEPPFVDDGRLVLPGGSVVRSFGESAGQRWRLAGVDAGRGLQLGAYLLTRDGRRPLEEGALDVPIGDEVAIELVAEPGATPWWRRLLGGTPASGEVRVDRAQVLLPPDRMPDAVSTDAADAADTGSEGEATGVIVYMIDTLRADRLGVYGSDRGLTPRMDELAEESVAFTDARAQSSWTRPSVASTFTGLYPQSHGVDDRNDALGGDVLTLAERLHAAGVATGAIFTNGNISHRFGLGQGFSEYRHLPETRQRESVHVLADQLNQWGLHWLSQNSERPFFLYLHATDPHAPYTPREPFAERFAAGADRSLGTLDAFRSLRSGSAAEEPGVRDQLLSLYDAEVAWTDHQLGVLIDALKDEGLWQETLFVVVSDHGEEFLDHGDWEHGKTLFDEQLRVPLLIKPPAGVGSAYDFVGRAAGPAGHVDLAPTILDALGVAYDPAEFDGRSLWPTLVGASERATGASMLSHLELAEESLRSVAAGRWKLIEDLKRQRTMLFDVEDDPAELEERSGARPLRTGVLGQERRRLEHGLEAESADEIELDEETKKQLEALGYAG